MTGRPISVLVDLRPAFHGHFGIPHENRLTFSLLRDLPDVSLTGLIQHPSRWLGRNMLRRQIVRDGAFAFDRSSKLAADTVPRDGRLAVVINALENAGNFLLLELLTQFGIRLDLDCFDAHEFGDFIWRTLFAASLPLSEFEACRTTPYASLWAPWQAMHATAFCPGTKYARVDTSPYDVLIAQTPWPGRVAPRTRLVVRYHDAMPLYFPHTVKNPRAHRFTHLSALRDNARSAVFACTSEYARSQLLKAVPDLRPRTVVVHDCISGEFRREPVPRGNVRDIIVDRSDPATEPDFGSASDRRAFYEFAVAQDPRFLLVVGTLEPRKNHLAVIEAWNTLRRTQRSPIALIFVGATGWGSKELQRAMATWQARGELFHLSGVPANELRALYGAAEAVICPSVAEGFDLPAVEAMRCGAVVVASDIAVHREILGDAVAYFNPYAPAALCNVLTRLTESPGECETLRQATSAQASKYDRSIVRDQWQQLLELCRTPAWEESDAGQQS